MSWNRRAIGIGAPAARRSAVIETTVWGGPTLKVVSIELRLTTTGAARLASALVVENPADLNRVWRHAILQLLDDYEAARRNGEPAHELLLPEPPPTGDARIDAALAALAEHLGRRDGWVPPTWVTDPARYAEPWWFVAGLPSLEATTIQQSPLAFRKRGLFITAAALSRA